MGETDTKLKVLWDKIKSLQEEDAEHDEPKNERAVFELLLEAYALHDLEAAYELARCYRLGYGCEENLQTALNYAVEYKKAGGKSTYHQDDIPLTYGTDNDTGFDADLMEWFEGLERALPSADIEYAIARSLCRIDDDITSANPDDLTKALSFYEKAAANGSREARRALAVYWVANKKSEHYSEAAEILENCKDMDSKFCLLCLTASKTSGLLCIDNAIDLAKELFKGADNYIDEVAAHCLLHAGDRPLKHDLEQLDDFAARMNEKALRDYIDNPWWE